MFHQQDSLRLRQWTTTTQDEVASQTCMIFKTLFNTIEPCLRMMYQITNQEIGTTRGPQQEISHPTVISKTYFFAFTPMKTDLLEKLCSALQILKAWHSAYLGVPSSMECLCVVLPLCALWPSISDLALDAYPGQEIYLNKNFDSFII